MNRTDPRSYLPLALMLLGTWGCASSGPKYHDASMDFGSVRSVAVLPFQNLSRDTQASDRVREVFAGTLIATSGIYVVPAGEVQRNIMKLNIGTPATPSIEEVLKLGQALKVDAVITGVLKEYGEVRSGNAASNVISVSAQMTEVSTGRMVWSASTTKGGITFGDRLLGSGGAPMNQVTEAAVDELLSKLFK